MRVVAIAFSLLLLSVAAGSGCADSSGATVVTVYKSPTCGCCAKWIDYMEANGFEVETIEVKNVRPVKVENGVPRKLASCHTALVDGYVVEGHVPVADVRRLLEERPQIDGIAVAGMPIGSPGMEGRNPVPYEVVSFSGGAKVGVFATHQGVSSLP